MYKPKDGSEEDLKNILKDHLPVLKQLGFITGAGHFFARSANGTLIEIFEWVSEEAKVAAHQHPAVREIWGRMMPICEFPALKDLPEAQNRFPNFDLLPV